MTGGEIRSLPKHYSTTHGGLMVLLTLALSLARQRKSAPQAPEAIPWHLVAAGLPPVVEGLRSQDPTDQRVSRLRSLIRILLSRRTGGAQVWSGATRYAARAR